MATYRVKVNECAVIEALLRTGRIDEGAALRRDAVEQELGVVVSDWTTRWLTEK
jgi:hypothetical protein